MNPNPAMLFTAVVLLVLTFMLEHASAADVAPLTERQETRVAPAVTELDGRVVVAVVRERLSSLQGCYERALKRDATLAGRVEIEFTISAAGGVEQAKVAASAMPTEDVGACVVARVRGWKFPASSGSLTVVYPFDFAPASERRGVRG